MLINCLIQLEPSSNEINEFVSFCKQNNSLCKKINSGDDIPLEEIKDLPQKYSSNDALKLYTEITYLYKLLNRSLRKRNINLLFVLRFFIRDIAKELEKNQCKSHLYVYRGQLMSRNETERLQASVGQLISINSFFSTSLKRDVAYMFAGAESKLSTSEEKKVLFKIEIDSQLNIVKPFAYIGKNSQYKDEDEILFMVGSVFRLQNVFVDDNEIWNIKMKLCSNDDNDLKSLMEHMVNEHRSRKPSLCLLGDILLDMGKFDDAENYYKCFLKQVPENHPSVGACYHSRGIIADEKNSYKDSREWYEKSIKINRQYSSGENNYNIAQNYNSIGVCYWKQHNYSQAQKYFNKALNIFRDVLGEDYADTANCYSNIGSVYRKKINTRKRYIITKRHY